MLKIDVFAHFCPKSFLDYFSKHVIDFDKLMGIDSIVSAPALWDVNKRIEMMNRWEDYAQVLIPTQPSAETFCTPKQAAEVARVYNDAMAEVVAKHPDKFLGAVAYLPLNDIDATLREIDRVIDELGFKGILLNTPLYELKKPGDPSQGYNYETMKPLDLPELMPIYETMWRRQLPIWIHPKGDGALPVYHGEPRGKYALAPTLMGWPVETSMAMSRLVCSGIMTKYPGLRIITHHCGAVIPALKGRLDVVFDWQKKLGVKFGLPGEKDPFEEIAPTDLFRMFYADTATYGDPTQLMSGYNFFGVEHILFGTDTGFGVGGDDNFTRRTIDAVYSMNISDADKQMIFEGNARRLLHLALKK